MGKATHTQVGAAGRIIFHGQTEGGVAPVEELLASIGAPSTVISRIVSVVREHMTATSTDGPPSAATVRRLARRLAPAAMSEWSLVCGADHAGRGVGSGPNPTTSWLTVAEAAGVDRRPSKLLLGCDDLFALGHAPGPQYRPVMEAALAAQDEGSFTDHAGAGRLAGPDRRRRAPGALSLRRRIKDDSG